ncbi:hypothetical protein D3C84_1026520 [compost metagenome]
MSRLTSACNKPCHWARLKLTWLPSNVLISVLSSAERDESMFSKVLRMFRRASGGPGWAAVAWALRRVLGSKVAEATSERIPAAILVSRVMPAVTRTASALVESAVNTRKLPAPVCRLPHSTCRL